MTRNLKRLAILAARLSKRETGGPELLLPLVEELVELAFQYAAAKAFDYAVDTAWQAILRLGIDGRAIAAGAGVPQSVIEDLFDAHTHTVLPAERAVVPRQRDPAVRFRTPEGRLLNSREAALICAALGSLPPPDEYVVDLESTTVASLRVRDTKGRSIGTMQGHLGVDGTVHWRMIPNAP